MVVPADRFGRSFIVGGDGGHTSDIRFMTAVADAVVHGGTAAVAAAAVAAAAVCRAVVLLLRRNSRDGVVSFCCSGTGRGARLARHPPSRPLL